MSKDHEKKDRLGDKQARMPDSHQAPIDPYTGEPRPLAEDANEVVEIVPHDSGDREGENYLLEEQGPLDKIAVDENADAISAQSARYSEDEEIERTFKDRQKLSQSGRKKMEDELDAYNAQDPDLSGGDVDAAWNDSIVAGEESVGGSAPTPDQDVVEEMGEALGIAYEDDEPLGGAEKLKRRDRKRWELDAESEKQERE